MKKLIITLVLVVAALAGTQAQNYANLQTHYDFGKANDGDVNKDRDYVTTTLEMFKIDSLGSTFYFVDFDYNSNNGASFAYWEIVRAFNIPKVNFMQVEVAYNDGISFVNSVWLGGVKFPFYFKNGFFSVSAYYRNERHQNSGNAQATAVWQFNVLDGKFTLRGFADLWTQDNFIDGSGKMATFLTEPQLWYNVNKHIGIGGEVEISYNFFTFDKDVEVMPTLGAKWTF